MADANQAWDVPQAIEWMRHLAPFRLRWIEEPTSPDDVLGHAAIRRAVTPVGVATGEHCANKVMFKQLLQAGAIDYCQVDACRLGGLNEVLAVLLLAAKFGVPVCPHAGGLGLCEYVQHISIIDYLCVSASLADRSTEFADHLHEHFVDPARLRAGRYLLPEAPGYSVEMRPESLAALAFPHGAEWRRALIRAQACAARPDRARRSRGWVSAAPRSATCTRRSATRHARATVDAAWDAGPALVRHRATLRSRPGGAAPGRRAARPAAR